MPGNLSARVTAATRGAVSAHLAWIYHVTSARPLKVSVVSLVILALASFSILGIRFENDIFKLFPSEKGALRLFLDTLNWSGSAKEAYFLMEGTRDALLREGEIFAARLKGLQVDGQPAFSKVLYRTY